MRKRQRVRKRSEKKVTQKNEPQAESRGYARLKLATIASTIACIGVMILVACQSVSREGDVKSFNVAEETQVKNVTPSMVGNPYDYLFDPMPLRVGTVGARYYHRPFSPTAQRSLVTHGAEKRINYYSIDDIPDHRIPAPDSFADIYEVPEDPAEFVAGDVYKMPLRQYEIPTVPVGYEVCTWAGRIAVAVPPENCDENGGLQVSADTELQMQMLYINAIPSGIGDATGDGNVDGDDFPYLIACYSGDTVAATENCTNCFDYDSDGDVDYTDFQVWFSEDGQGNRAWMAANYPAAIEKPQKTYPLRVGVEGSNLYHRPDCPAVLRSRDRHGWHKFYEFYTRADIEASGRIPDTHGPPNGCDATLEAWEN